MGNKQTWPLHASTFQVTGEPHHRGLPNHSKLRSLTATIQAQLVSSRCFEAAKHTTRHEGWQLLVFLCETWKPTTEDDTITRWNQQHICTSLTPNSSFQTADDRCLVNPFCFLTLLVLNFFAWSMCPFRMSLSSCELAVFPRINEIYDQFIWAIVSSLHWRVANL